MESLVVELWLKTVPNVNNNHYGYGNGNGAGNGNGYGDGNGYGNGYGNGDGNGYGAGYGDGYGAGDGAGDGAGYGDGNGDGDGLKSINNNIIYIIDNIPTIITNIKNNIASGYTIKSDLSLNKCYIVKQNNTFSHGYTIKQAIASLEQKLQLQSPISERILNFKNKFNNLKIKYKAADLYNWHFILTGSCDYGRDMFCKNNNIDLKKNKFTILEFIDLTQNNYKGEIIKQLKESYNITV